MPMSKQHRVLAPSIFVDFDGAFINWSDCVLCVPVDTLGLRCMMFIFCVKETDLGLLVFVAYSGPWCSGYGTMSFCMYHAQCNVEAASPPGVGSVNFCSITVAWTSGGGGGEKRGEGPSPFPIL